MARLLKDKDLEIEELHRMLKNSIKLNSQH